jgi:N-acetylneuraminic acid mutarotase
MVTHYERLYIFGGCNYTASFNTLWVYDFEKDRWTEVNDQRGGGLGEAPSPRDGAAIIVSVLGFQP